MALLDAAQIRQVIMNLGVNACQALADNSGTLAVRLGETVIEDSAVPAHPAFKPGPYLQLTVRDTGCGMSDEVVEHIFDPFFSTKVPGEGCGMGLAIPDLPIIMCTGEVSCLEKSGRVKTRAAIVWEICSYSQPGSKPNRSVGLNLPSSLSPSFGDTQPSQGPSLAQEQLSLRILLAEDNLVNQEVALVMLEPFCCRVDVVEDRREAVAAVSHTDYDIVLMDCQMPELDGFAATRLIREREAPHSSHLPIIALTANAMQEDRERCVAAGMDDYLSKPFTQEALWSMLVRWASPPGLACETREALPLSTQQRSPTHAFSVSS